MLRKGICISLSLPHLEFLFLKLSYFESMSVSAREENCTTVPEGKLDINYISIN